MTNGIFKNRKEIVLRVGKILQHGMQTTNFINAGQKDENRCRFVRYFVKIFDQSQRQLEHIITNAWSAIRYFRHLKYINIHVIAIERIKRFKKNCTVARIAYHNVFEIIQIEIFHRKWSTLINVQYGSRHKFIVTVK